MSDEYNWETQNVADLAERLSSIANDYRTAIADIYNTFNNIGIEQKWVGKNFNIIADICLNSKKSKFEEWADYLQNYIPQTVFDVAEDQAQEYSVSFSLTQASMDIPTIQETVEKSDGSQILDPSAVRTELNESIPTYCETALERLQAYYSQFEELGTLKYNEAMSDMYNELDGILTCCKEFLDTFLDDVKYTAEKSIQGTELTNEETIEMANRLAAAIEG